MLALEKAMDNAHLILLCSQKRSNITNPEPSDIYSIGTVGEILQLLKLPDGTIKVLIEGTKRVRIKEYLLESSYFLVNVEEIEEPSSVINIRTEALMRTVLAQFEEYCRLSENYPAETTTPIFTIEEPGQLADVIIGQLILKVAKKQELLSTLIPEKRLESLSVVLGNELEIVRIEKKIQDSVYRQMDKSQKEYYLTEQLQAIQKELGNQQDEFGEIGNLKKQIKKAKMSKDGEEKALKEIERLKKMPSMMPEATVIKNYIEWLVSLPWNQKTKDKLDLKTAKMVLEQEHYGLKKVKERIIEYLAVRKLSGSLTKGPILCFVGPPGTGKTSVAKSIATAMGRNFVRLSLGGVRDEAEIRGHRMTYVAALPGRIIQSMKRAKSKNPVFLLDEIDKMSMDFRGDPSAALLEVLDPEQNVVFSDHYIEVPFDISDVLFIATANTLFSVPPALQDRMEILEFPSYTEDEKFHIAKIFLMQKQLKEHGLSKDILTFSDEAILEIIQRYTREAGVRNLEREIATVCRKIATIVVENEGQRVSSHAQDSRITITADTLLEYLGPAKYLKKSTDDENQVGVAMGLAWTEVGGEVLTTEVVTMPGKGELILTGQLGDVMKESGRAALSYIRSKAEWFKLDTSFYKKLDIHIHLPEGALPKDGPSAGITMATAIISALTNNPIKKEIAMTGEITLQGRVLPVGGIKEKILAAHRAGVKTILLPEENKKDLIDIPNNVQKQLDIKLIKHMDDVLKLALVN